MKLNQWITISVLTIIALASGLNLILEPDYFEIQLQDGSIKAKYADGVFKLYDGRYKVLENYYSPECYDGGYKKVYKARGDKYENLTYYTDGSDHYINQVIHYSKGECNVLYADGPGLFRTTPGHPGLVVGCTGICQLRIR